MITKTVRTEWHWFGRGHVDRARIIEWKLFGFILIYRKIEEI